MFQPVIERYIPYFKYYDEIIVVLSLLCYLVTRKFKLRVYDVKIILLFFALCCVGIVGNIVSKAGQLNRAILQDMFSNGKMILFALSIRDISLTEKQKGKFEDIMCGIIHALFLFMFVTSILSQFVDIGMTTKARHGIKSYQFIFNNPAGLNTYYYLFIILHSITLIKNGRVRKRAILYTIIGVVPWMLTMRSRAIAFAILYMALYVYVIYIRKPGKVLKFHWYQVIIVGIIAVLLSWDAIDTYFISNDKVARYNLMHTSFRIAIKYFPIGSGFGTFGTEASRVYYSSIYYRYGFSSIYGLTSEHSKFITDQFWFGIIGQFGIIGTLLMAFLIFYSYRNIWAIAKDKKASQLACVTFFMTSIFASLTAGTFIQASILPSILIFYLLCNNRDEYEKINQYGW